MKYLCEQIIDLEYWKSISNIIKLKAKAMDLMHGNMFLIHKKGIIVFKSSEFETTWNLENPSSKWILPSSYLWYPTYSFKDLLRHWWDQEFEISSFEERLSTIRSLYKALHACYSMNELYAVPLFGHKCSTALNCFLQFSWGATKGVEHTSLKEWTLYVQLV